MPPTPPGNVRQVVPQNALPPQAILVNADYEAAPDDTTITVETEGVTVTLPQNPSVGLTSIQFFATLAFFLSGGIFSPLSPSDPLSVTAGSSFFASFASTGWVLSSSGGGGGGGVTAVTAAGLVQSSGGDTPEITFPAGGVPGDVVTNVGGTAEWAPAASGVTAVTAAGLVQSSGGDTPEITFPAGGVPGDVVTNVAGTAAWAPPAGGGGNLGQVAEYVQLTQGSNSSIAPGSAVDYLVDSPDGVVNTIGITTTTGPGGQGTAFNVPPGTYFIDWSNSNVGPAALAIYKGDSNIAMAIDPNTIAGSSTGTTWIHARAYYVSTEENPWMMISPVTEPVDIPTAGPAAGQFVARITFLRLT